MITNLEEGGKIKCQRYWPETGRCGFGPFTVTLTDEQIFADYTIRKLEVQVRGELLCPLGGRDVDKQSSYIVIPFLSFGPCDASCVAFNFSMLCSLIQSVH